MSLVIKNVLRDELNRLERMEKAYCNKIKSLSGVVVCKKKLNGRRLVSKSIKNNNLQIIKAKIEKRKSYQKALNDIREEINFINKALKIK